eukprot:4525431-Alexandrium_andersonii.AAC.1
MCTHRAPPWPATGGRCEGSNPPCAAAVEKATAPRPLFRFRRRRSARVPSANIAEVEVAFRSCVAAVHYHVFWSTGGAPRSRSVAVPVGS